MILNFAIGNGEPSDIFLVPGGFGLSKITENADLMRLERARELLESGDSSMETIAVESGLSREERLRRVFIRQLGVSPSQYRLRFQQNR